jgi:hypothetical protein
MFYWPITIMPALATSAKATPSALLKRAALALWSARACDALASECVGGHEAASEGLQNQSNKRRPSSQHTYLQTPESFGDHRQACATT